MLDLIPSSSGFTKFFDRSLKQVRQKISYVPQRGSVEWDFPATVFDVVLMGRYGRLGLFQKPNRADKEIALESLKKVNMEGYKDRQIAQLSGGQQQRVFLARALTQQADLYLMDEPFVGVDASTERAIVDIMEVLKAEGKSIIVVHHDLQSARKYFDWMILLNMRLVASGPIEDVFTDDLLQETYGGRLTLLSQVGNMMGQEGFPTREK
jgi:manganese/zinc/iron transport system ATP- binding protein